MGLGGGGGGGGGVGGGEEGIEPEVPTVLKRISLPCVGVGHYFSLAYLSDLCGKVVSR